MVAQYAFLIAWLVTCSLLVVSVALRGGWAERAGVTLLITGWLLSVAVVQLSHRWVGPQAGLCAVDVLFLMGMFVVGLQSHKLWPLITCGFQLCGVCLHIAYMAEPHRWSGAYFVGLQVTSVAVLGAVTVGALGAWRGHGASQEAEPQSVLAAEGR